MKRCISVTVLSLAICAAGCSQQTADESTGTTDAAGQAASNAVNETSNAASDAAESAEQAAGTTVEAAKIVVDDAVQQLGEAKESVEEETAAAREKASLALSNVEGGPALLKQVTEFFESAEQTLDGITDTDTAQAAVAKFNEMGGSIESLSTSMNGLPAEAQSALAAVIERGVARLQPLIDKANAISGVKEILQPKVDELMQKLLAQTAKE